MELVIYILFVCAAFFSFSSLVQLAPSFTDQVGDRSKLVPMMLAGGGLLIYGVTWNFPFHIFEPRMFRPSLLILVIVLTVLIIALVFLCEWLLQRNTERLEPQTRNKFHLRLSSIFAVIALFTYFLAAKTAFVETAFVRVEVSKLASDISASDARPDNASVLTKKDLCFKMVIRDALCQEDDFDIQVSYSADSKLVQTVIFGHQFSPLSMALMAYDFGTKGEATVHMNANGKLEVKSTIRPLID